MFPGLCGLEAPECGVMSPGVGSERSGDHAAHLWLRLSEADSVSSAQSDEGSDPGLLVSARSR